MFYYFGICCQKEKGCRRLMNKNDVISIMDIPFFNGTMKQFFDGEIIPALENEEKRFFVTANPEIVMATKKDLQYKSIVQSASAIVPDGIGILLAAKWKQTPLKERIAGYDVFLHMLRLANERGASCYFLGANEQVNENVVEKVMELYPNIDILGHHHGYIGVEDEEVFDDVQEANADFVFVALGFPKQEEWIHRYQHRLEKGIMIGLGGSFDVLAGHVKRAPQIWITLHLEWFYRLAMQPSRWRRMIPLGHFLLLSLFRKV